MPPASNDNQGLKIAVAALVMLVFILAVTNYFAFSSSSQNFAKFEDISKKKSEADTQARNALEQANTYRTMLGYPNLEDVDAVKSADAKHKQAVAADIQNIGTQSATAIATVLQAGGADPKLDDLKGVINGIVTGYVSEPNENRMAAKTIDRLKELLVNQSHVLREMSLDYLKLRKELGSANSTNAAEVAKAIGARDKALQERQAEIDRFKTELQSLYDTITNLQNTDKDKTNQITDLTNKLTDETNKLAVLRRDLGKTINDLRDKDALKSDVLPVGKSIGRVTYVDYSRGETRLGINRGNGVRPLMRFTVFDRDARGIPNDRPKGTVEIISAGDPGRGERDSLAKIIETKDSTNPIRYNDQLYSPSLPADSPTRFALVGKMDINRDGKDDRTELIRMIEQSGGIIEYDLAPPGIDRGPGRQAVERAFARAGEPVPPRTGLAWGRISMAKAYVIDERRNLVGNANTEGTGLTAEDVAFNKEKSEATREARTSGVPPMQLSRLLTELGYSPPPEGFGAGALESRNKPGMRQLLKPKPVQPGANAPGVEANPDGTKPDAAKPDEPATEKPDAAK